MEWYYVWWPWLTYKRVAQVFQHQLSFWFSIGLLFQSTWTLPRCFDQTQSGCAVRSVHACIGRVARMDVRSVHRAARSIPVLRHLLRAGDQKQDVRGGCQRLRLGQTQQSRFHVHGLNSAGSQIQHCLTSPSGTFVWGSGICVGR